MIISPTIFKNFNQISAAQSTRLNGKSNPPYSSLNLGKSVGDDIENVEKNRDLFFEKLQCTKENAVFSYQIHGAEILVVNKPGDYSGFDAQITNRKNICLAVSIADCPPILIYDTKNEAIAAIHAGWKGTVADIVTKTLKAMEANFGTKGQDCYAYVGTCISKNNFEVNADVANHFEAKFKVYDTKKEKFFIDLKEANKAQLLGFGIPEQQIEVSPYCTVASNDMFFSHRKEKGTTGRMLAAICMHANVK
jgi:polyphenol oxidase